MQAIRLALRQAQVSLRRGYAIPVRGNVQGVRFLHKKEDTQAEVLARYKAKLEKKAHEEGLPSSDALREKMKDEIAQKKKQMSSVDPLKELEDYEEAQKLKDAIENKKGSKSDLGAVDPALQKKPFKTLDSFVKLEKLENLPENQIALIWRARFHMKEHTLCASVPGESFDRIYRNARRNPSFVLPLPKEEAQVEGHNPGDKPPVEMHYVQWAFVGPHTTHVMITSLEEYKLHKQYARPHTTIAFHNELRQKKGLVLMNGQVEKEAAVSLRDAQLLLLNLQRFYGGLGEESKIAKERLEMVKQFNSGSGQFDVPRFIELCEAMEN